jgi:hypothetical protein
VSKNAVTRQRGGARRLTGPDAGDQDLGIGLAGEFYELGAQVLLKGSSGQRRAGGEFVARLIRNVPHRDGRTHSIIMQLMLLKYNRPGQARSEKVSRAERPGPFGR